MSNALAISGVTAVLQYYLTGVYSGLSALFGGTVTISSQAPDILQNSFTSGTTQNQVNLFMHQVTHNPAWRNIDLPSLAADGKTQLKNPPLALDLHYLLTAYGSFDWQAEALLGYALLLLHDHPVISRNDVRNALNSATSIHLPQLATALATSGLADQIEMIKITPATLGREEMAWLWTALKADYRPTFPFQVSVVLMYQPANVVFALPVMTRVVQAVPVTPAALLEVRPPNKQPAALQGDTVTVTGEFLAGASQVTLDNSRLGIHRVISLVPAAVTNTSFTFPVPVDSANFPAGFYDLSVQFLDTTGKIVQSTNTLPIAIAPAVQPLASVTAVGNVIHGIPGTLVKLTCNPDVHPRQNVSLILSGAAAPAKDFTTVTNALSFQFTPALPSGLQLIRLQVDGVTSLVTWQKSPPAFTGPMVTI
jgi:Pvc16 N-terminal domain